MSISYVEKKTLNRSLREAYKRNNLLSVERIVQNFPDPKYAHNMRIYYAIEYADEKEVESLIGYAITDVNWSNDVLLGEWSLLHQAAYWNKVSTLEMILKHGGDVNVQDGHYVCVPTAYTFIMDTRTW